MRINEILRKKVEEILSIDNVKTNNNINTLLDTLTNDKKWMKDNNIQSIKLITIPYQNYINTQDIYTSTNAEKVIEVIGLDYDFFKHQYLVANTDQGQIIIDPNTEKYRHDKAIFIGNIQALKEDLKNLLSVDVRCYKFNAVTFEVELGQEHTLISQYIYKQDNDPILENHLERCVEMLLGAWYGNHISKVKQKDPNSIISSPSSTSLLSGSSKTPAF